MLSKGLQLFLVSLLIGSLPAQTLPAALDGASPDTGHAFINHALVRVPLTSAAQLALFPQSQLPQQPTTTPTAQIPHGPGWARRHLLLFAGLAMTGGGAALVAGGGPGQASGCLAAGPYGQIECTTVSTWGMSGRHIGGILLLCAGVPVAILGIFKHP
jgi:hypothetical protein